MDFAGFVSAVSTLRSDRRREFQDCPAFRPEVIELFRAGLNSVENVLQIIIRVALVSIQGVHVPRGCAYISDCEVFWWVFETTNRRLRNIAIQPTLKIADGWTLLPRAMSCNEKNERVEAKDLGMVLRERHEASSRDDAREGVKLLDFFNQRSQGANELDDR